MKKITLLLALLITSIGFSQTELITNGDFSNDKDSWGGSEFSVVNEEAFFSSTNAGGNPWDTQLTQGSMSFVTGQGYTFTFKARAAANRKISVSFQNVGDWGVVHFTKEYDLTTTMTTFQETFSGISTFANVQVGFLLAGTASSEAVYIDDVSVVSDGSVQETCSDGIQNNGETGVDCGGPNCNACPADPEPTDAPTTPPSFDASNVISFYSESYTNTGGLNDVTWDEGATSEEITIDGNKVLKIKAGNFVAFDFGQYIDASSMTHLHMDYWLGEDHVAGQVLNPKLSNHAGQNGETSAMDISNPINSQDEVKKWQSKDFALNGDRGSLKEFLVTVANFTPVFYLDNIYLFIDGTASVDNNKVLGFSMFPNPAKNELRISAKETISKAEVFNVLGRKVKTFTINSANKTLDVSSLSSGIYLIKYESAGKVGTAKFIKQ